MADPTLEADTAAVCIEGDDAWTASMLFDHNGPCPPPALRGSGDEHNAQTPVGADLDQDDEPGPAEGCDDAATPDDPGDDDLRPAPVDLDTPPPPGPGGDALPGDDAGGPDANAGAKKTALVLAAH